MKYLGRQSEADVIPAQAGIQNCMDSRLRGNDKFLSWSVASLAHFMNVSRVRRAGEPDLRRLLVFFMAGFVVAASFAAPLPPAARAEIDGLLARLEASRCEFQRNGTWHSAADARSHLQVKLRALEERGVVNNAEQFIERAASQSSLSGQPYQVRCANGVPMSSRAWLLSQLQLMRSAPGVKDAP